jgi:hypothetical protein
LAPELVEALLDGIPEARDRVEAAKALVMLDLAVFKADRMGMLKRPIEEVARLLPNLSTTWNGRCPGFKPAQRK